MRNPVWLFDEILLVAAFGIQINWRHISKTEKDVIELSELLQKFPTTPDRPRGEKYRNIEGVYRKYYDLKTIMPDYEGKSTRGGETTSKVMEYCLEDTERAIKKANKIRKYVLSGEYQVDEDNT